MSDAPPPAPRRAWLDRDLVVASSAIVISVASLAVSVQQTRMMREQQQASVWPRLTTDAAIASSPPSMSLTVRNAGVGPAKVVWGQVLLDGVPVARMDTLFAVAADTARSIDASTYSASLSNDVLSAGQAKPLLRVEGPLAPLVTRLAPRLALVMCYCSVFDTCWELRNTFGRPPSETITEVPVCAAPKGPTL